MKNKQQVELKEIFNPCGKPYLFLIKQEESKVHIVSSYDKDFYKEFIKLKEDYCNDVIEYSKETKELLEKDISYLLDNYRFDEEMLKEGKDLYRYEELQRIIKLSNYIREKSLYDWKKDWLSNLRTYSTIKELNKDNPNFYSILEVKSSENKMSKIIYISKNINDIYRKYFLVNTFWQVLAIPKREGMYRLGIIKNKELPEVPFKDESNNSIIKDFSKDTLMLTRNLLFPYEQIIEKTDDFNKDIFTLLDELDLDYPRKEIKEHLLDCIFIKEYEEKHKEGVKTYEKNIFQRLRKLF